ncbi:hypothetical protein [Peristeroidobacter agariperforans]|uniref:hypothetical protein n=1 Tax=Peristeroidobacter agariperforans TaxID=268404 RepID=UPI00101C403F|nr:hypothetical protein [Peristeroidobacter agariperforans]
MRGQSLTCLLSALAFGSAGAAEVSKSEPARTANRDAFVCPVTVVNEGKGGVYGNEALDVVLNPGGKFVFAPGGAGFVDRDGALGIKVGWERRKKGPLQLSGRRLDGPAGPARAYIYDYGDIGFQPIYLVFPTPGCWEITGRVADASLTFVAVVEKIGDGPGKFEGLGSGWRVSR